MFRFWIYPALFASFWTASLLLESPYSIAIAIFLTTVVLWILQVYPLYVTSLLIPVPILIFEVLSPEEVIKSIANPILLLFIGCFLMTQSMQKHGWTQLIAKKMMSWQWAFATHNRILFALGITSWFLSMWISNTATCAMMVPIALGILHAIQDQFESPKAHQRFTQKTLLLCAFSSSIGGIATPVGSPPNMLAVQSLQNHHITVHFIDWMKLGLPLALIMFLCMFALLFFIFPTASTVKAPSLEKNLIHFKMSTPQQQVALVFGIAIFLWIISASVSFLNISYIGFIAGASLFFFPIQKDGHFLMNLHWKDGLKIDWQTIALFAGGLCLGSMLEQTGLAQEIAQNMLSTFQSNFLLLTLIMLILSVLLSEFASNTASAAILIPIMIGFVQTFGLDQHTLMILTISIALGTSYGFMLPVSTPPNAIVFGTKLVPLKSMLKAGFLLDMLGILLIWIWVWILT